MAVLIAIAHTKLTGLQFLDEGSFRCLANQVGCSRHRCSASTVLSWLWSCQQSCIASHRSGDMCGLGVWALIRIGRSCPIERGPVLGSG